MERKRKERKGIKQKVNQKGRYQEGGHIGDRKKCNQKKRKESIAKKGENLQWRKGQDKNK